MTRSELSEFLSHATTDHEEKALLLSQKYHSFSAISEAPINELAEVLGQDMKTAAYIKIAIAIKSRIICNEARVEKMNDENNLSIYLTALFATCSVETVYVLSIDANGRLISADKAGEGTVNASTVMPRRIIELAKLRRAHAVAVAHNHPNGEPAASHDDTLAMEAIRSILVDADIRFMGGYVVAGQKCAKIDA